METGDSYISDCEDDNDDSDAFNEFSSWYKNNALSVARRNKQYLLESARTRREEGDAAARA